MAGSMKEEQKNLQELLANMDTTIYRLNLLCNRFEKDKDTILKEGLDVKDAVKSLQREILAFANMRGEVDKVLANRIKHSSETMAQMVGEEIKRVLETNVENTIYRLEKAINYADNKLRFFHRLDKRRIIYMGLGLVVLPVVTGVFVAKIFMSEPIMRFNGATCEVYKQRCYYESESKK